jgi:hypothetical protein
MTVQARHLGSRLLLILALVAALLAGIVLVQRLMGRGIVAHADVTSSETHYMVIVPGGDGGGGKHRDSGGIIPSSVGGDVSGGH